MFFRKIKNSKNLKIRFVLLGLIVGSLAGVGLAQNIEIFGAESSVPVEILAESAILIDQKTGNVLYEYNSDQEEAPASLTKIMSLILIFENLENGNLSEKEILKCSKYANSINGSQIWLDVGEEISVHDLLKAVIVSSANDATVVLAEKIAGSERAFVEQMNERAKSMGLRYCHFENCTGLDQENHLMTAREVAVLARELLKHEKIFDYTKIWMDRIRDGKTELVNTNRLIRFYPGANGLKTGTSDNAGYCLAASATRENLSLISVVMGAKNTEDRFEMSKMLLNYGFGCFKSIKLENVEKDMPNLKIEKGKEDYVGLKTLPPDSVLIEKNKLNKIKQKINIPEKLEAPILENQIVGSVDVLIDDKKILDYPIITSSGVDKIDFISSLKKIFLELINL